MKNSQQVTDWILGQVSARNPYDSSDKNLAVIWALGFLARCCAEMIWRDTGNLDIFRRCLDPDKPK